MQFKAKPTNIKNIWLINSQIVQDFGIKKVIIILKNNQWGVKMAKIMMYLNIIIA